MGWACGATEELAERGVYSAEQFNALTLQLDAVAVPATPAPSRWTELGSYVVWPTTFVHVCEWAQVLRDPVWQSIHCIQPHLLHKFQGSIHAVLIVIATVALFVAVASQLQAGLMFLLPSPLPPVWRLPLLFLLLPLLLLKLQLPSLPSLPSRFPPV